MKRFRRVVGQVESSSGTIRSSRSLLIAKAVRAIFLRHEHVGLDELRHKYLRLLGGTELALALVQLRLQLVNARLLDLQSLPLGGNLLLLFLELSVLGCDGLDGRVPQGPELLDFSARSTAL